MFPSIMSMSDEAAAYRRQLYLHSMPASARAVLEHNNRRLLEQPGQQEPDEYREFIRRHSAHVPDYPLLQQFYAQLAFAADIAQLPGFAQRFFTFRDSQTYSACTRPRILAGHFGEEDSLEVLQALQNATEFTISGGCKALSCWIISTADADMLAALDEIDCPGSRSRVINTEYYQASYWDVDAEHFSRVLDLILRYQGDYVLPFGNDSEIAPIHLKQLAGDELQTLTGRQDAWL